MLKSGSETPAVIKDPRKTEKQDLSKANQVSFFFLFIAKNNKTESRCLSLKICTSSRRFQGKKQTKTRHAKKDTAKKGIKKTSRWKKSRG